MKKEKKIKIRKHVIHFYNIRQVAEHEPKPEPPCEFEDTIPNGTCDKLLEKIISESNEEKL